LNSYICLSATLLTFFAPYVRADVPTPPSPPPTPAGYCSTIAGELNADITAFNLLLAVPPIWAPVPGGPTIWTGILQAADANAGPAISSPGFITGVLPQLYEEKAMGFDAVLVQIGFPALYAPFVGGEAELQPYLNLYQTLAQDIKALGLKLIVENDILLTDDIQTGWPNLTSYFKTLSWTEYMQARATMAATIAETMQPDYLVLAEEPDTEASNSGQSNLLIPADAAQMVSGEISAVRASTYPNVTLGAGFGAWPQTGNANAVEQYTDAYVALPLDYIDAHIYPINTETGGPIINDILTIASLSAAANKPVAVSEDWVWKMENSELNVLSPDQIRARNPFSFWQPLDISFQQTMQSLAKYANMVYVANDGPDYLFAYQTYGGTTANGGAANCMCTTSSCNDADILQTETNLARTANQTSVYTGTGFSFASGLIQPPDTTPPSTPSGLTASPQYTGAALTWNASTDNVGVAGYNVLRCAPAAEGQSCTGVWIANTSTPSYNDSGLAAGTPYNYQVQAFDLANNNSGLSAVLSLETYKIPPTAPQNLTATAVSATEISLSWSPPETTSGLTEYVILRGPSSTNLTQVATVSSTKTTYKDTKVSPSTSYYYGVEAVENGADSPTAGLAWATSYPFPNAPTGVTATPSGSNKIVLSWQQTMAKNGLSVIQYQILQGTSPDTLTKVATVSGMTYTTTALDPNTTYYFEIVAVDTANDDSAPSSEVSGKT